MTDGRKYIFAFIITALIFGTAIYASNYFSKKKLAEIQTIENRLSLDILSSETQYSLLEETSCKDVRTRRSPKSSAIFPTSSLRPKARTAPTIPTSSASKNIIPCSRSKIIFDEKHHRQVRHPADLHPLFLFEPRRLPRLHQNGLRFDRAPRRIPQSAHLFFRL